MESKDGVDVYTTVTVIKFCVGLGKSPTETMKLIRSSQTMNPCSVSVVYKWHEKFRKRKKIKGGLFEEWLALRCENDYDGHHFLTRLAKTLTKHDV